MGEDKSCHLVSSSFSHLALNTFIIGLFSHPLSPYSMPTDDLGWGKGEVMNKIFWSGREEHVVGVGGEEKRRDTRPPDPASISCYSGLPTTYDDKKEHSQNIPICLVHTVSG